MTELVEATAQGLYCARGGFYLDPWAPVDRAVLTHAHADHARPGSGRYLCTTEALPLVRHRLPGAEVEALAYGERRALGDVSLSFHPSGHVRGAAQVRLEADGEVWVVTGDFKHAPDPTCAAFEPLRCHALVTEATFALPIFRWEPTERLVREVLSWWEANRARERASVLYCYALGKAQRLLAELADLTDRPVYAHGAVEGLTALYAEAGVRLLPVQKVAQTAKGKSFAGELVLAPPSARGTPWTRRFGDYGSALASGWMRVRGPRRRQGFDRGFALSDHADWPALLRTVKESGAQRVRVTHGYTEPLARYLREALGLDAAALRTPYEGESE